ncbi:MAG: tetratricopeptide repeat protein [Prevotellaceae bacterium]|nr:tetratricopeptide repeat protein [Prevotellaceae bacterium]
MAISKINDSASSQEPQLNGQEAFFLKFRKQIIIAVAVVVAAIACYICYTTFLDTPRQEKASTALAKAQEAFAQGDFQKALNGDKAQQGFLAVSEDFGGTDAANLARLYAGLCYANLGKWQEAVKYLDDFSTKDDAMISPAATAALGNALAHTGDIDKAISTLKKAAKMADSEAEEGVNNSLSPTFLIQAARLLESQNKQDEALAIYKEIKEKYVNSAAAADIDKYIERATK